ncbi:glycosyltransferase family 4 protein [Chryseobacterium sp. A301]
MKILYIHQYFVTPKEPGGTRSYWIAQELIRNGYNVTMITSSSKFDEKMKRVNVDGIDVIYVKEGYDQNMSVMKRLTAFMSFMYKASRIAIVEKDVDLVIATSTPLTIGIPALLLKWFKRIPYIFEVRDLWPEVPIQMGALNNTTIRRIALYLEKLLYKNARHVVALSPGMQHGVIKYISKNKTSMIPNMAKINEFWPRVKDYQLIDQLGLEEKSFKIIHFGSLGIANGADTIIESAKILKDDNSIEFLFVGGGSTEAQLIEECRLNELNNVKFLGKFSMSETSAIVNIADASIISFKNLPILYTNSPNKLFDSLSAGKPIIVNSAGWTKDIAEEFNCGVYVNPEKPQDLVEKIKYLQNHPEVVKEMGLNSRALAENKYDKSILTKEFVEVVQNVFGKLR